MKWGLTEHSHVRYILIQLDILENLQCLLRTSRVEEVHSKIQRQQNKET